MIFVNISLFFISGKRLQEIICVCITVSLMIFNFAQLFYHFRFENWFMIGLAACEYDRKTIERPHEKSNNIVFEQVRQKPGCTATEDS